MAPESGYGSKRNGFGRGIGKARLADMQTSWAWAIPEEGFGASGSRLAAVEYASPDSIADLRLAFGSGKWVSVSYAGEKSADADDEVIDGQYDPTFEGTAGPVWRIGEAALPAVQDYILLPESCKAGALTFAPANAPGDGEGATDNHGHPEASVSETEKISKLYHNRKLIHSELLAVDSKGGRVSVFQFAAAESGLLVLAYIRDNMIITKEFTANVYDGSVYWRADAESGNICLFEVRMLCETDEGLAIGFVWYGPEGTARYLLAENEGTFTDLTAESWYYDIWMREFVKDTM